MDCVYVFPVNMGGEPKHSESKKKHNPSPSTSHHQLERDQQHITTTAFGKLFSCDAEGLLLPKGLDSSGDETHGPPDLLKNKGAFVEYGKGRII